VPKAVCLIDLPATVLDWFGLARPVMFEGHSLLAQAEDTTLSTGRPAFVEFARYEIDHDGFGGWTKSPAGMWTAIPASAKMTRANTGSGTTAPTSPW
jgi:arylsulfatase A-like enzyme